MGNNINWGQEAANAGQQILNSGMGLLLEGHNDRRQLRQQGKLQALEIQGQQQMTDYNMAKQLQMWKDTNYKAQMNELKQAGLNPGLIYGMSGGGGVTTGQATGNVTGGKAPEGGNEVVNMLGMGIQRELLEAQKANIEANTENIKADTANKPLTGKNIEASTGNLLQGIENAKSQQALTEVQTAIANIEEHIAGTTQNHIVAQIYSATKILRNDQTISDTTVNDKIKEIKAQAIGALLENSLTRAKTAVDQKQLQVMHNQIIQILASVRQGDKALALRELEIFYHNQRDRGMYDDNDPIKELVDQIILIPTSGTRKLTEVRGFHKRQ